MKVVETNPIEILSNDRTTHCDEVIIYSGGCDLICHQNNEELAHSHQIVEDVPKENEEVDVSLPVQQVNEVEVQPKTGRYSMRLRRTVASDCNNSLRSAKSKRISRINSPKVVATAVTSESLLEEPVPIVNETVTRSATRVRRETIKTPAKLKVIDSKKTSHSPIWSVQPKFDCFECKQRFTNKDDLEVHRMTHSTKQQNIEAHPEDVTQINQGDDELTKSQDRTELTETENSKSAAKRKSRHHPSIDSSEVSFIQKQWSNIFQQIETHGENKRRTLPIELETNENDDTEYITLVPAESESRGSEVVISTNQTTKELTEIDTAEPKTTPKNVTVETRPKKAIATKPKRRSKRRIQTYECKQCDAQFTMIRFFLQHLLSHTREISFKCGYCSSKFASKNQQNWHEQRTHMQSIVQSVPTENVEKPKTQTLKIPKIKLIRINSTNMWSVKGEE